MSITTHELVSVIIFTSRARSVNRWFLANPHAVDYLHWFVVECLDELIAPDLCMLANVADKITAK